MKDIQVKIYTKQIYSTHVDNSEETYSGKISQKGDNTYIIYKEEDKEKNITNQIKITKNGAVTIRRMGFHQSTLHFELDKSYKTLYKTAHGDLHLTFIPNIVDYRSDDVEHRLLLNYDIYMDKEKLSNNLYKMEIS